MINSKFLVILLLTSLPSFASEPLGFYSNGSLVDAASLPIEGGVGWRHLHEEFITTNEELRKIWGTDELVSLIHSTAAEMQKNFPNCDNLQVEDLSAQFGGDIPRHGSHQNGLDADLGFFKADCREHVATPQEMYAPSMVEADGSVSKNFDLERNWELMKTLHKYGSVNRIFLDQKLKDALCKYAQYKREVNSHIEVLRSLRHVTNHKDHLHVRLNCPPDATRCKPQAPPPKGHGCRNI